ncbi:hypothetical protein CISIN_1g0476591mg, partial [Citrus sinensis]
CLIDGYFKSQI